MKISSFGSEKSPLEINLTELDGTHYIDIRNWYFDKKTSELKPTTKGLTLSKSKYFTLVDELSFHSEKINEWFANEYHRELKKTFPIEKTKDKSNQQLRILFKILPNNLMYDLESRGDSTQLLINKESLFGIQLKEIIGEDELDLNKVNNKSILLLINLIIAFQKASNRICSNDNQLTGIEFMADLNLEWKRKLDSLGSI